MIASLRRTVGWAALALLPWLAHAQITFSFTFSDTNSGFNDPVLGATRRAALQSAATTLSSYLVGYAPRTVNLTVDTSYNDTESSILASAGSSAFAASNSFQRNLVQTMIQTGSNSGQSSLGTIVWNFGYTWDYDDNVSLGAIDFKSVAMHELIHTLGFESFISSAGTGLGGGTTWSIFDQFLTDAAGNRLVTAGGVYNGGTILTDDFGSDVYFSGPNAMAANGGQRVHIFSPSTFRDGSSLSHLDTDFFTSSTYIMEHAVGGGPGARTLSAIELGILADIGYSVAAIPEPATVAALAGATMLGFALWRRRAAGAEASRHVATAE